MIRFKKTIIQSFAEKAYSTKRQEHLKPCGWAQKHSVF